MLTSFLHHAFRLLPRNPFETNYYACCFASSRRKALDTDDIPIIHWFPGHIAKAEKELVEFIKLVDVVVEVRDARIPNSTAHPMVSKWVESKPVIIALNRSDMVQKTKLRKWRDIFRNSCIKPIAENSTDSKAKPQSIGPNYRCVVAIDGKRGQNIHELKREILKTGEKANNKRVRLGLRPRSVRALVIGYPNVGKSAIINQLLGRKLAKSYDKPGVTRQLQWVRLSEVPVAPIENEKPKAEIDDEKIPKEKRLKKRKEDKAFSLDLLDTPGIIPAKQVDKLTSLKLAICNDIGQASYDILTVATSLLDMVMYYRSQLFEFKKIVDRYKIILNSSGKKDEQDDGLNGETVLHHIAESLFRGNEISAAERVLSDFRSGRCGRFVLDEYPQVEAVDGIDSRSDEEENEDDSDEADDDDDEIVSKVGRSRDRFSASSDRKKKMMRQHVSYSVAFRDDEVKKDGNDRVVIRQDEFDDRELEVGRMARRKSIMNLATEFQQRPSKVEKRRLHVSKGVMASSKKRLVEPVLPWNGSYENW